MRTRSSGSGGVNWAVLVREFDRCGETHEAFCARRGLNVWTFRRRLYAARRLARGSAPAATEVSFVPVDVVASSAAVADGGGQPSHVVIVVAGVELRAPVGTDARYVAWLVAELRRC